MTLMLDIIGDYCGLRGYTYSRIDGTMDIKLRQENVSRIVCFTSMLVHVFSSYPLCAKTRSQ